MKQNDEKILQKSLFFSDSEIRNHFIIFGSTGKGMSNNFSESDNLSYQEDINEINQRKLKQSKIKKNHLNLFKSMEELEDEFHHLFDYSEQFFDKKIENLNDFCILYFNIPQNIFGNGISFGFDDSVVRDDLYEFFETKEYDSLVEEYNKIINNI